MWGSEIKTPGRQLRGWGVSKTPQNLWHSRLARLGAERTKEKRPLVAPQFQNLNFKSYLGA